MLGPLDADGRIDYASALNERLKKGVTPETNSVVLLWNAIGPRPEDAAVSPEYFRWMDIQPPAETGVYFVKLARYAPADAAAFHDKLERATRYPWTESDFPELARALTSLRAPLSLVLKASLRPHYFSPLFSSRTDVKNAGLIGAGFPSLMTCRELVRALNARSMLSVGQERMVEAWQDLIACHRLGRLVGQGSTWMEAIVSLAMEIGTTRAGLTYLERANSKQIEQCKRDLSRLSPLPDMAEKADLGERFLSLDTVMMFDRFGLDYSSSPAWGLKPPKQILTAEILDGHRLGPSSQSPEPAL